jgi:hypothetical protein
MSDQTPPVAAANATRADALALNDLTVIGLMQAHDGPAALLRSPRGQIARVQVGAAVFGVKITAIGEGQVFMTTRGGQTKAVSVAGS